MRTDVTTKRVSVAAAPEAPDVLPVPPLLPPAREDWGLVALVPELGEPVAPTALLPPDPVAAPELVPLVDDIIVPVTSTWWPTCCLRFSPSSMNVVPPETRPDAPVARESGIVAVPEVPAAPLAARSFMRAFVSLYALPALAPVRLCAVAPAEGAFRDSAVAVVPLA